METSKIEITPQGILRDACFVALPLDSGRNPVLVEDAYAFIKHRKYSDIRKDAPEQISVGNQETGLTY